MAPRRPTDPLSALPDAFTAYKDGWTEDTLEQKPYEVVLDNDFSDHELGSKFRSSLSRMKDGVTLERQWLMNLRRQQECP